MPVLYDHSPVGNCETLCRDIQERIDCGDCRIVDLLGEEDHTRQKPEIFRDGEKGWSTGPYIGLFQYGDGSGGPSGQQVVIASRFDRENPQPFFLWYLIESFLGESMISLESMGSTWGKSFFDELLAVRLAVLMQQAFRKGGLRAYRTFGHNDSRANGVLDVARHIRENLDLDNGRLACRTQVYSLRNPWNVLFLQADARACRRFPDLMRRLRRRLPEYAAALRTLAQAAPGWEDVRPNRLLGLTARPIVNPIYREWEPVRCAARALLRRMGADLDANGSASVTGVFLDMDRLWERLLEDRLFCGAERPFSQQSRPILHGHMQIRPDFYFSSCRTVLDAKNRPAWEKTLPPAGTTPPSTDGTAEENALRHGPQDAGSPEGRWSDRLNPPDAVRDNVYQILSYMLALDCSQGGVVFPSCDCRQPVRDSVGPPGLWFWRIPVHIPRAQGYAQFRRLLEDEFCRLRALAPLRSLVSLSRPALMPDRTPRI